jgi:hypothetical protein
MTTKRPNPQPKDRPIKTEAGVINPEKKKPTP